MKILLANKYYYARGGADIHSIDLEELLKDKGHEVAFFSMQHPLNQVSDYSDSFPGEVDFNERKYSSLISALLRPFGSYDVRKKFTKLLKSFKPDIVHLHNIHTQISPVLTVLAHKRGIPVVWTLHDHKLVCPRYDCMRRGKPCILCFTQKYNVIKYRCVKESVGASTIAFLESVVWNRKIVSRNTDFFICPSKFLLRNMIKGGYKESQLIHLPNFILDKKLSAVNSIKKDHYCFIGRLSPEKGVETLLKAAVELPQFELQVIGTGPLENSLKQKYERPHIKFLGFKEWTDLKDILNPARCMVFPSECFENNPLSIIESLCYGTPVIGSRIGGITELVDNGVNGFLYEPGNIPDLKNQIVKLFQNKTLFNSSEIAEKARLRFRSESFYETLIKIYAGLLNRP